MTKTMNSGNELPESGGLFKKNGVKAAPDIFKIIGSVPGTNPEEGIRNADTGVAPAEVCFEYYFKSNTYTYIGRKIPRKLLASFTSCFEKDFIKNCKFYVLYGGAYGFAIAKYQDEFVLLVKTYKAEQMSPDALPYEQQGVYSLHNESKLSKKIHSLYLAGNEFIVIYSDDKSRTLETVKYPVLNPSIYTPLIHCCNDLIPWNRIETKTEGKKISTSFFSKIKIARWFSLAISVAIAGYLLVMFLSKCNW